MGYACGPQVSGYPCGFGFLLVQINGQYVTAQFHGDADGDGYYEDVMDSFTIVPEPAMRGLLAMGLMESFAEGVSSDEFY